MLKIAENNVALTATKLLAAMKSMSEKDPELRVKNPFTSGLNFADEEVVTFAGFGYSEWSDDESDKRGVFPTLLLKSGESVKPLSLSVFRKRKGGVLIDPKRNSKRVFDMWGNEGGLAAEVAKFTELSETALKAVEAYLKGGEHRIQVRWVQTDKGFTSLVNIL